MDELSANDETQLMLDIYNHLPSVSRHHPVNTHVGEQSFTFRATPLRSAAPSGGTAGGMHAAHQGATDCSDIARSSSSLTRTGLLPVREDGDADQLQADLQQLTSAENQAGDASSNSIRQSGPEITFVLQRLQMLAESTVSRRQQPPSRATAAAAPAPVAVSAFTDPSTAAAAADVLPGGTGEPDQAAVRYRKLHKSRSPAFTNQQDSDPMDSSAIAQPGLNASSSASGQGEVGKEAHLEESAEPHAAWGAQQPNMHQLLSPFGSEVLQRSVPDAATPDLVPVMRAPDPRALRDAPGNRPAAELPAFLSQAAQDPLAQNTWQLQPQFASAASASSSDSPKNLSLPGPPPRAAAPSRQLPRASPSARPAAPQPRQPVPSSPPAATRGSPEGEAPPHLQFICPWPPCLTEWQPASVLLHMHCSAPTDCRIIVFQNGRMVANGPGSLPANDASAM